VGSALGGANVESIPEYFAKPNIVEGLVAAHPVLLVRQMANEILRLRSSRPAIIEECARVCDELYSDTAWHPYYRQAANNCAETIRAKIHQWRDIKVVGKDAIRVLAPREQNAATQVAEREGK
jgi:hypothetical protein